MEAGGILDEAQKEVIAQAVQNVRASDTQDGITVSIDSVYVTEFYLEMLRMFRAQSAEKLAEIAALYESANWPDYAVKVHALKSTSLTIGAEELSAQAKALELAGKGGDVDYIQENHPALLRGYVELCAYIDGI